MNPAFRGWTGIRHGRNANSPDSGRHDTVGRNNRALGTQQQSQLFMDERDRLMLIQPRNPVANARSGAEAGSGTTAESNS